MQALKMSPFVVWVDFAVRDSISGRHAGRYLPPNETPREARGGRNRLRMRYGEIKGETAVTKRYIPPGRGKASADVL